MLLPRESLPLHIFEPRYRRMLADRLSGDRQFGVVCRQEHVAERDIPPGTVGCVAEIDQVVLLPDGQSDIVVNGGSRFTLERFVADAAPYHVGEVAPVNDVAESPLLLQEASQHLRALFTRVGRSARALANDPSPLPDLPDDADISFAVAQHLDLGLPAKQALLASRSPSHRLHHLVELLEAVADSMDDRAQVHQRAGGNGGGPPGTRLT